MKLSGEVEMDKKIAVTLSFLISGFWERAEKLDSMQILDALPVGEDGFVYGCYDIARAIEILNDDFEARDRIGVYHYDVIEDMAGRILYDYVDKHHSIPLVLEFIGQFKPLLEEWYKDAI